jgi:hypothetical protein
VGPDLRATWDSAGGGFEIFRNGATVLQLPLDSLVTALRTEGFPRPDTTRDDLRIRRSARGVTAEVRVTDLNVRSGEPPVVDWVAGWLLVEDRGPP